MEHEVDYAIPVPELIASNGHNRLGALIERILKHQNQSSQYVSINPKDLKTGLDPLGAFLWRKVEKGKKGFKKAYSLEFDHRLSPFQKALRKHLLTKVGNTLGRSTELLRGNMFLNHRMLGHYYQQIEELKPKGIISSHYMAFMNGESGTYLIPDMHLHKGVDKLFAKNDVKFVSPFQQTTQFLKSNGVSTDRIFEGTPIPNEQITNRREKEADERQHFLITIGSDAPEANYALEAIKALKERGCQISVLCGGAEINGQTINNHFDFRTQAQKLLDLESGDQIFGGEADWTREQDNQQLYELLGNPDIDGIISRPNEMVVLSQAFGKKLALLPPFQHHEQIAYDTLIGANAALTIEALIDNPALEPTGLNSIFHPTRSASEFMEFLAA